MQSNKKKEDLTENHLLKLIGKKFLLEKDKDKNLKKNVENINQQELSKILKLLIKVKNLILMKKRKTKNII